MDEQRPDGQAAPSRSNQTVPVAPTERPARLVRIAAFLDSHDRWLGLAVLVVVLVTAFWVAFGLDPRVIGQGAELKDFFNDVVALCVVVMFAKFISHGRGASRTRHPVWTLLHALCLIFAALGVFAALRGAEGGDPGRLYDLAWVGAVVSTGILVVDVFLGGFRT